MLDDNITDSITHRVANKTFTFTTPAADSPIEVLNEYYWTEEKEPHFSRRKLILARHPEVAKLTGYETKTKWYVIGVVLLQFYVAYYLRNTPIFNWKFIALAYVIGATANQALFLAIHELSHNLLFKKPIHNKIFAVFTNLPIGIPYAASFQPYHQLHHKFLGDKYLDADLPTKFESVILSNVLGKVFFATFQILFYALRPMFVTQIKFTSIHLLNIVAQVSTDYVLVQLCGWHAFGYFIMSSFLAGSLHPCAGHFIAEHYVLNENNRARTELKDGISISADLLPPETYSYYGSLNLLTWNVGYHNEHHDFPYIAWTKLPELRRIAHEFYDPLPQVKSWCGVIWYFCFDDINTLWNRVKRDGKEKHGTSINNLDQNN
ncbi:fatty acid desaturase [Scheffersomyces coipomensis]|uniref:fatty acid desaturase n=1 Tax=Scheffersomyces coipomensis TaxID=1788519 RepID=UPI00315C4EBB